MSCDHCVLRVGRAIASVQGVIEVDVNLRNNKAIVDFEETITDIEEIKTASGKQDTTIYNFLYILVFKTYP